VDTLKNLIGGTLEDSPEVRHIVNPTDGSPGGSIYDCTKEKAHRALLLAESAARSIRSASVDERRKMLETLSEAIEENAEIIAGIHIRESGKPIEAARNEVRNGVGFLRYFASIAPELEIEETSDSERGFVHRLVRTPVGVVVSFLPFNFPSGQFGLKVGAALATGNACIVKSSEKAPLAHAAIGSIIAGLNLPDGIISVLSGDPVMLMETLAGSSIPRLVTLIGSTGAGTALARTASTSVKKFDLELGGNSPFIVSADADLDLASNTLVSAKLSNAGQICVAPNRVLVERSIHDQFVAKCKTVLSEYSHASEKPNRRYVPLITREHRDRVLELIRLTEAEGATIVCGGGPDGNCGNFVQPTMLTGVRPDMAIWKTEIFGPVISLTVYDAADQAIAMANDTEYGLAAYVFSSDTSFCERASREIDAGTVLVNGSVFGADLPHGGLKQSGIGKAHSRMALDPYYDVKRISRKIL